MVKAASKSMASHGQRETDPNRDGPDKAVTWDPTDGRGEGERMTLNGHTEGGRAG